jgi:ribose transport system permease protein
MAKTHGKQVVMKSILQSPIISRFTNLKKKFGWAGTQLGALMIINLIFIIFLSNRSPAFLTTGNMLAVGVAMAGNTLCAMGSVLVLLTGGFDLSVGSSYGLAGVVVALALLSGAPVWLAILAGMLTGLLIGLVNGFLVSKAEINAFIVTMGTMTIARGLINVLTQGYSISGLPESFTRLVSARILGLPPSLVIMIVVVVITDLLLRFWRPARQLYYIGASPEYARLVGIPVNQVRIIAFAVSGVLAAIGGILFTARTGAASQQAGIGIEMMALLAPFLGGVGFGGKGTAFGAFMGALLIALIINTIQLLGIAALWQNVIIGACLILAALIGMTRIRQVMTRGIAK